MAESEQDRVAAATSIHVSTLDAAQQAYTFERERGAAEHRALRRAIVAALAHDRDGLAARAREVCDELSAETKKQRSFLPRGRAYSDADMVSRGWCDNVDKQVDRLRALLDDPAPAQPHDEADVR